MGQQKLAARLVAIPLPKAVAAERRRKATHNRDIRCQPSATYLTLLGCAIFVTNVHRHVLSARAVAQVYGLRWRIETIFKAWKRHFRITQVPEGSPEQSRSIIYACLIVLTVMIQPCTQGWPAAWQAQRPPPRSLLNTAALLVAFFLLLCPATVHAGQFKKEQVTFQEPYPQVGPSRLGPALCSGVAQTRELAPTRKRV